MEEYLTIPELSERIKMAPGTIRNLVWKRKFKEGTHYLKPTPRKILFVWGAVKTWLHGESDLDHTPAAKHAKGLINI